MELRKLGVLLLAFYIPGWIWHLISITLLGTLVYQYFYICYRIIFRMSCRNATDLSPVLHPTVCSSMAICIMLLWSVPSYTGSKVIPRSSHWGDVSTGQQTLNRSQLKISGLAISHSLLNSGRLLPDKSWANAMPCDNLQPAYLRLGSRPHAQSLLQSHFVSSISLVA